MIKVRAREQTTEGSVFKETVVVREHAEGQCAQVYNGTLTIYKKEPLSGENAMSNAIAGYEPHGWLSWCKE
jgi:hypothetical protein